MAKVYIQIADDDNLELINEDLHLKTEFRAMVEKDGQTATGAWCDTLNETAFDAFARLGSDSRFIKFEERHCASLGRYISDSYTVVPGRDREFIDEGRIIENARLRSLMKRLERATERCMHR